MAGYRVLRGPSGGYEAVKSGYSMIAFVTTLVGFGWIWAFARRAWAFGARLLIVTIIVALLLDWASGFADEFGLPAFLFAFFWVSFSIWCGRVGNNQVRLAFLKKGYVPVGDGLVEASGASHAIEKIATSPATSAA